MLSDYADKIKVTTSLRIKDIKNAMIFFTEIIILNFNFSKIINEELTIVKLFKEVRIVNNLSVEVLIEINIINSVKMTINVNILIIDSCKNTKVDLSAISKKNSIKKR